MVDLVSSCIFPMPWWLLYSSERVLSCSCGGMQTLVPSSLFSTENLSVIHQKSQAIPGTWYGWSDHLLSVKQ